MAAGVGATIPMSLDVAVERFALANPFTISRGSKTEAVVVTATLSSPCGAIGRGECVPYARYGETVETTTTAIRDGWSGLVAHAADLTPATLRASLAHHMTAGAARNAVDCAIWDLEAKITGTRVWHLAGMPEPTPTVTCLTVSLDTPKRMASAAAALPDQPLLKLKLGGEGDAARLRAVRAARPDARLVADANEAWTDSALPELMSVAAEIGLEVVEQPLPVGRDAALARITRLVPVCADESVHRTADLAALTDRYDAVNVKLDKTGGLTEALAMVTAARALGLDVMVGSMVATSLSMAPAMIVAHHARWVDLDSPALVARDRDHALAFANGILGVPTRELWG